VNTSNGGTGTADAFYVFEKDSSDSWNEKIRVLDSDCNNFGGSFHKGYYIDDDTTGSYNHVRLLAGCTSYANPNLSSQPTNGNAGVIFGYDIGSLPPGSGSGSGSGSDSGSGSGSGSGSDKLADGEIAGIAVGCIAFAVLVALFLICRRRKRQPIYVASGAATGQQRQPQPQVIVVQA
jgi:hypothetical protein